jgi:hypothetical protein
MKTMKLFNWYCQCMGQDSSHMLHASAWHSIRDSALLSTLNQSPIPRRH